MPVEILPPEPPRTPASSASQAIVPVAPASPLARLTPEEQEGVRVFLLSRYAKETIRAYERAWASWRGWCLKSGHHALPADPAALVMWLSQSKWGLSKVEQVLSAISRAHQLAGYPTPTQHVLVRDAARAMRRVRGRATPGAKAPVVLAELQQLLQHLDRTTLAGKRDAALLLMAWWSACRRSEVVALTVEDVVPAPGGLALRLRRSKTDQEGRGQVVGVKEQGGWSCPVGALQEWLKASGITKGPIFRAITKSGTVRASALGAAEIPRLVKRLARASGLDPTRLAGHSLRAGHVTQAYLDGVPEAQIQSTTRHKSVTMLARYRRMADPVKQGSSSGIKVPPEPTD